MTQDEFCDEFMLVDLRDKDNCLKATKDCTDVYNLAADMGGMGFIQVRVGVLRRLRVAQREWRYWDSQAGAFSVTLLSTTTDRA